MSTSVVFGQQDSTFVKSKKEKKVKLKKTAEFNPLAPSKAAFYSMIFPGAGQIYNNKYWWQLPLIYGGLGYSIRSYSIHNKDYKEARDAFKLLKAGLPVTGRLAVLSETSLETRQEQLIKNRNYSLLSAILVYALQIIEASVTAHLLQFDTNESLSITPSGTLDNFNYEQTPNIGLSLKYNF